MPYAIRTQALRVQQCQVENTAAEFHGYEGERFVLTIITEAERPPEVMGFRLLDDNELPLAALGAGVEEPEPLVFCTF